MTTVLGLDLSLTSTGLALADDDGYRTARIKPRSGMSGHERLDWIIDQIVAHSGLSQLDVIVVEGPSYGSQGNGERQKGHHERAGLWWIVTHYLWHERLPVAVAPPAAVKRYATGKGNAGKDDVLREVCRRFPAFTGGNDEADALVLAAMGADQLGHPVVTVPANHRLALIGVEWPDSYEPVTIAPKETS